MAEMPGVRVPVDVELHSVQMSPELAAEVMNRHVAVARPGQVVIFRFDPGTLTEATAKRYYEVISQAAMDTGIKVLITECDQIAVAAPTLNEGHAVLAEGLIDAAMPVEEALKVVGKVSLTGYTGAAAHTSTPGCDGGHPVGQLCADWDKERRAYAGVAEAGFPVIDPDCRDGKHTSCVGGPCACECHAQDTL